MRGIDGQTHSLQGWIRTSLAIRLALAGCLGLFGSLTAATHARSDQVLQSPSSHVYLPFVLGPPAVSPAGHYQCTEHEYGLIYENYAVELHEDGTSRYLYPDPFTSVVTGTWVYTPFIQTLGFTQFRWLTATYTSPYRFHAEFRLYEGGTPTLEVTCWRP